MRGTGVVWVVAVMLAVAIGAGTAFAQAPVVPATTVVRQSDVDVPEVPNVEVNVEVPNVEVNVEVPNVEVNVEVPNVEVNVEAPNLEKSGKAGDGKAKPANPKPKPAQPKSAEAGAPPSAPPSEPGPAPQVDTAKSVSPRMKAAPRVAAPKIRHGTTPRRPARNESHTTARRPAGATSAERSATERAGSGRESADATSVSSHRVAATPRPAPRLASEGAAAGPSLARQQPRVLILDAREPGDATMLLALVLTAGVAFLLGREARRRPAAGSRRSRPRPPLHPLRPQGQSWFWHRRD